MERPNLDIQRGERLRNFISRLTLRSPVLDEERNQQFGERFIELARSVYVINDDRANAKKKINLKLNSSIVEEKSYQDYK